MRKVLTLGIILTFILAGCQIAPNNEENIANEKLNATLQESIYNISYEPYNQLTDLGVILYMPTESDLEGFAQVDQYISNKEMSKNMLIIPKYVGTKITINRVEYTGERYIAKEELFNIESTPSQYGLLIGKECTAGTPQLGIYMTYKESNVEYIFGTKDNNNERDYLKVELETPIEGEYLSPIADEAAYLEGLESVIKSEIDFDQDGLLETIEIYKDHANQASGEWALIMRKGDQVYPLFERNYVEHGGLGFTTYEDFDNHKPHILIGYSTDQVIIYYDCIWEDSQNTVIRQTLYEIGNMKKLSEWWYKLVFNNEDEG